MHPGYVGRQTMSYGNYTRGITSLIEASLTQRLHHRERISTVIMKKKNTLGLIKARDNQSLQCYTLIRHLIEANRTSLTLYILEPENATGNKRASADNVSQLSKSSRPVIVMYSQLFYIQQ